MIAQPLARRLPSSAPYSAAEHRRGEEYRGGQESVVQPIATASEEPRRRARRGVYRGSVVERVQTTENYYELHLKEQPYIIRGAGMHNPSDQHARDLLLEAGANSIRTWNADNKENLLEWAEAHGMTVTLGIRLEKANRDFSYSDKAARKSQFDEAKKVVEAYRDFPALLLWGIGNEVAGWGQGDDPDVWTAVNDIAKMIKDKDTDGNHPTMTVIADVDGPRIERLRNHCPDIDILGVNSYGRLADLPRRLKEQGLDRPYIVTEFGPIHYGEMRTTAWDAPIEPTSTEKADHYFASERLISDQRGQCLGSYAFLWGNKQERTATWFGMLLPDGECPLRLGAVDVMTHAWTGRWPANRAPLIDALTTEAAERAVACGEALTATVTARDLDGDPLTYKWQVYAESNHDYRVAGPEPTPREYPEAILSDGDRRLIYRAPLEEGKYRLFVTVRDGKGNAATANVPFLAKRQPVVVPW
jgi:hypothetical protein